LALFIRTIFFYKLPNNFFSCYIPRISTENEESAAPAQEHWEHLTCICSRR
jgi:hypothetical protein